MSRKTTIIKLTPQMVTSEDDYAALGLDLHKPVAGWWIATPGTATNPCYTSADGPNSDWDWDGPYPTRQEAEEATATDNWELF